MLSFEECAELERQAIAARQEARLYTVLKPLWLEERYERGEGTWMVGAAFNGVVDAVRSRSWQARRSLARALFEAEAPQLRETQFGPAEFRTAEGTWSEVIALGTLTLGRTKVHAWMVPHIAAHAPICAEYLRRGCLDSYEIGSSVHALLQLRAVVLGEAAA